MRRICELLIFWIAFGVCAMAQIPGVPSVHKRDTVNYKVVKALRMTNVDLGVVDTVDVDSAIVSYQDNTPVNNYSIANSWNGNLGSPLESKLFFRREDENFDMFSRAYAPYLIRPKDVVHYNAMTPYSNFTYRTAMPTYREEDYLKVLLTLNANKRFNIGGLCNFIYGRGQYQSQSTRMVTGGLWSSYDGERYEMRVSVFLNSFKNRENGGISDLDYLLSGRNIAANNYPVNLSNAQSNYRNFNYYLNHRYHLGKKMTRTKADGTEEEYFQPMISIIHTFNTEDIRRRYTETNIGQHGGFYANNYYSDANTADSTAAWRIRNTVAVALDESFNKFLRFGLSAFVEYDVRHYGVGYDTIRVHNSYYHDLNVGAVLAKNEGKYIRYNVDGKIYLVGPYIGNFELNGNLRSDFNIVKEPFRIEADVNFENKRTFHLYETYYSNHFKWEDNVFKNSLSLKAGGRLSLPKRDISVGVQFQNITNYVYLDEECKPVQHDGNVQVLSVDLKANLKAWRFHLDSYVVYQLTGNRDILPLPDVALYSTLYYKDKFFKVLTVQIGASVRYHTAYYGNVYMPALGQFHLQKDMKIGNYPEMNVYANFHLKTVRFFVQYYHFNKGLFGGNNYMSMPGYPINPATLQFGFSWNFWK